MTSLLDNDFDIFDRNLIILGVTPTDYTADNGTLYDRVNCICMEKLKGDKSYGFATTNYHYGTSANLSDFSSLSLPVHVKAQTSTVTDLKSKIQTEIVSIDFSTAKEIDLVLKDLKKSTITKA